MTFYHRRDLRVLTSNVSVTAAMPVQRYGTQVDK